jgi:hypothetical protein
MGLFLQICGVIFLTLIVLLIVGALVVRSKLRRLIRSLDALSRTVPGTGSNDPASQVDADADAIDVSFTTLDESTGNRPTP